MTALGYARQIQSELMVAIKVKKLVEGAQMPRYAHVGEYGDLAADLYASADARLEAAGEAGSTAAVATGIAMEFPPTHGALVEDRSGLAVRGVTTLAGVIDPGYRGEIRVVMTNLNAAPVEIKAGEQDCAVADCRADRGELRGGCGAGRGGKRRGGIWQYGEVRMPRKRQR